MKLPKTKLKIDPPAGGGKWKVIISLVILILSFSTLNSQLSPAFAQVSLGGSSFDVGFEFDVNDSSAQDGDILISTDKGLIRASQSYDNRLFGVVQKQPVLIFRTKGSSGKPVARSGVIEVNVSTQGGDINPGDYITSSELPGVGQKATISGYVIGIAMGNLKEGEGKKKAVQGQQVTMGKIPVALKIEYAEVDAPRNASRMFAYVGASFFKSVKDPEKFVEVVRYVIAGIIAFGSFLIGFFTFAKAIPKGVEAVGRNPLAKNAIQLSIILNIVFTLAVTLVGIVASVLIIRL